MPRPRKWSSDAERREAQNTLRKLQRAESGKPVKQSRRFTGIDGEGVGQWRNHTYVLLGIGNATIEDTGQLSFMRVMSHLWERYTADPNSVYAGFFLGYDFSQWFRTLPREKAYRLFHPELRERHPRRTIIRETGEVEEEPNKLGPWPVTYQGWEFDLLGMKRFKLRPEGGSSWMYVNDAGPFFQASLLSVINPREWNEPIVTEDEYAQVKEGKSRRDVAVLDDDMRRYNALENDILARLLVRLDTGFQRMGVRLGKDQWFGPGQAASAWLANIHAPTREVVSRTVPRIGTLGDILHKGRMTYYGGWFEIFAHGHIPGITWEYDINSAYPFIMSRLPCILHGEWRRDDSPVRIDCGSDDLRIIHGKIRGSNPHCGAMLHRRPDHSIVRPHTTAGWYWEAELASAMRAGLIDEVEVYQGVSYRGCECSLPLRGMADLYTERIRVGKNTPEGKACKLLYNSPYGKFAQSIGNPKYANAIYASLITSGCRTIITDAIGTHPNGTSDLVMVATDGVYFRSQHPGLSLGSEMGSWEEGQKSNLTLFKPGVYWDDSVREQIRDGKDPRFKSRGVNASAFARSLASIDNAFSAWGRNPDQGIPDFPSITFTSGFSMVTPLQALQRGKWELAGTLGHEPSDICPGCSGAHLVQDSDPVQKRRRIYRDGDIWRSFPWENGGIDGIESTPYDKAFGQPDPDEYGITDDGTVLDGWRINP